MQLVMADASQMAQSFPMPTFAGVDPAFQQALMTSYRSTAAANSMMMASFKRSFCGMLDMAVQQVSADTREQVQASEAKVTNVLRTELQSAQTVLRTELQATQTVVDTRFTGVDSQLQEMKKSIDAQDPVTQAWRSPANIHLRQIISWILHLGLDTACTQGMSPLVGFAFYPGREETEDNHLTVMPKALVRMLVMHRTKFEPPVINGIQSRIEAIITPIFKCLTTLTTKQIRELGAMFPVKPYNSGGVYVFKTKHLIRMMQEEIKYIKQDQSVLKPGGDFSVESTVASDGSLDITKGINAKQKKSLLGKFRELVGIGAAELFEFAVSLHKKKSCNTKFLFDFLARRRYWGIPATKEHLSTIAFHLGVAMVRRDVFNEVTAPFDEAKLFHVGLDWKLDYETPVQDFATAMPAYLGIDSAEFKSTFAEQAAAADLQLTDTDSEDGEDGEETKQKPKRKRVIRNKGKKRKQPSSKSKAEVEQDGAKSASASASDPLPLVPLMPLMPVSSAPSAPVDKVHEEEEDNKDEPARKNRRTRRTTEIPV